MIRSRGLGLNASLKDWNRDGYTQESRRNTEIYEPLESTCHRSATRKDARHGWAIVGNTEKGGWLLLKEESWMLSANLLQNVALSLVLPTNEMAVI